MNKYDKWIAKHYPTPESTHMKCHEAVTAMATAFLDLRVVKGHVYVGLDYRPHWWCVTAFGEIVDPTAHQWEKGIMRYDAWVGEEPIGKCLECGEYSFKSKGGDMYLCAECMGVMK